MESLSQIVTQQGKTLEAMSQILAKLSDSISPPSNKGGSTQNGSGSGPSNSSSPVTPLKLTDQTRAMLEEFPNAPIHHPKTPLQTNDLASQNLPKNIPPEIKALKPYEGE
jgi:hypothetical protein